MIGLLFPVIKNIGWLVLLRIFRHGDTYQKFFQFGLSASGLCNRGRTQRNMTTVVAQFGVNLAFDFVSFSKF